ncbi:MAG: hypothetical protein RL518_1329 [Pseudomonadota bacterium]|jgi:uncharacterized membrane protein YfcA
MEDIPYLFLALFAFLAGLVDSVSGGGGLIQLPALLVAFPSAPIALLFGTNKFSSVFGTAVAAVRFSRAQSVPMKTCGIAGGMAFIFSFLGARSVSLLDPTLIRPLVIVALFLVLAYTVFKPSLGDMHIPKVAPHREGLVSGCIGGVLGFYDGFFGPGTGSFMLVALVTVLGFDFMRANTLAKVMNVATNIAALAYFIPTGNVLYSLAIVMALANVAGSLVGVTLALTKGARFVRGMLIVVVLALLIKQISQLF